MKLPLQLLCQEGAWRDAYDMAAKHAIRGRDKKSASVVESTQSSRNHDWLLGLLLIFGVFIAYQPVWHAGFIWDDDTYVTENHTLRSLEGLGQIWFHINATPQYYPLVHSVFWLEYHLWGLNPSCYHLVNIFLQALAAVLLWLVLRQIQLPGAWLAAAIFALHPIQTESVAWVTECKNVLSAVFYFAAALAYFRFEKSDATSGKQRWFYYFAALALFEAALLSKTITCSLPAALLLVFWWKKGRLSRQDVLPLTPFFAIGAGMGLLTAWIEKHHVGAQGADWSFTPIDRCLIAGRALWFYAGKLFWPAHLTFIYPHWKINTAAWWQWLFPSAAVCVMAILWLLRCRIGRGPLVAVLFFAGTLVPALGFVNVYPMRYSFVADHFQYLASIGLIALCATGLSKLPRIVPGILLLTLGVLTWQQSKMYKDIETLWLTTIEKNPKAFLACNNLGAIYLHAGQIDKALPYFEKALEANPDFPEAHSNLGEALMRSGRLEEGLQQCEEAVAIAPDSAESQYNFGRALLQTGQMEEAMVHFKKTLEIDPDFAQADNNMGVALLQMQRLDEAGDCFQKAIEIDPNFAEAHCNLGGVYGMQGQLDKAVTQYEKAIAIKPDYAHAHGSLAAALAAQGKLDEAVLEYRRTLALVPDADGIYYRLGLVLQKQNKLAEAISEYQEAVRLNPHNEQAIQQLQALGMSAGP